MDLDLFYILIAAAAAAGVLITLLGMGFFRTPVENSAEGEGPGGHELVERRGAKGRPGEGPATAWFVKGGGRLGALRFKRWRKPVEAVSEDLAASGRVHLQVGIGREDLDRIRELPWGDEEAGFLSSPADGFLIMLDRPLGRFDPRYDRYVIVPLGFMEGAGGVEAFLGALAYQVMADEADPMDTAEALLRDAAEVAVAAGFAPPDVLRALVEMLRRHVFSGRYRPFLGSPGSVPPSPIGTPPTASAKGPKPARVPPPELEPGPDDFAPAGPVSTELPPLRPAPAQPPPTARPKGPRKPQK